MLDLRAVGVKWHRIAPPAWRLLWLLGLRIPPPLFMRFGPLLLTLFAPFAILVAGFFVPLGPENTQLLLYVLAGGLVFGALQAWRFRSAAGRLGLPLWKSYLPQTRVFD